MTELSLIQSCQRNDRNAQRQLFELHYNRLMNLFVRYAKSDEQAKDMLCKGFSLICQDIPEFRKEQNFEEWMMKKMVHFAVSYLRERRQEYFITSTVRIAEEQKSDNDLFSQVQDPDEASLTPEQYVRALQMLPPSFRAVYNMSVIEGYTDDEVSKNLEISVDTCRYNLSKAKSAYYKNLQQIQSAA